MKDEQWVLVTGGSSGIGLAIAKEYATLSRPILIVGRDLVKLKKAQEELLQLNSCVEIFSCDLATSLGIDSLIEYCRCRMIYTLINCVGGSCRGRFVDTSFQSHQFVLDVNMASTLKLTHFFAKKMEEYQAGEIMIVSSFYAFVPVIYQSIYAGAKAFLLHWGRALRKELASQGIHVSIVTPGLTRTSFSASSKQKKDLPFLTLEPSFVARRAVYCLTRNKDLCIPGCLYAFFVFLSSFFSWKTMAYFVSLANKKRNL